MPKILRTYLAISLFNAGAFGLSAGIWYFFLTQIAGFWHGNAVLLTALSAVVSALFEVPTGSWADRFGRKNLYILGSLFVLVEWVPFLLGSKSFALYAAAMVLAGVGMAIQSGNLEALVHDALAEEKQEAAFRKFQAYGYSALFLGKGTASVAGGFLYLANPFSPYAGALVIGGIAIFCTFLLPKVAQNKSEARNDLEHISQALRHLQKEKGAFLGIALVVILSSLWNVYYFAYQPYFKDLGFSAGDLGLIFGGLSVTSAVSAFFLGKWGHSLSEWKILSVLFGLLILTGMGFVSGNPVLAIVSTILNSLVGGQMMSLGNAIAIKNAPSTHKSTVLSLFSLAITGGYGLLCLPSGYLIELFGMRSVFLACIGATGIAFLVALTLVRRERRSNALQTF